MIERSDNAEGIEPKPAKEPMANVEANDPIEPIDRIEPTLPTGRMESRRRVAAARSARRRTPAASPIIPAGIVPTGVPDRALEAADGSSARAHPRSAAYEGKPTYDLTKHGTAFTTRVRVDAARGRS